MESRFAVKTPCSKSWAELDGDDLRRHCGDCNRFVHAFDQYSPAEREKIWFESEGRVCAKIVSEANEPQRSRRIVLAGALLTAISPLMAQTGQVRIRVTDVTGAVIPRASVSLLEEGDKTRQTLLTDEAREVVWTDLPIGNSRFRVSAAGFDNLRLTATIKGSKEAKLDGVLQIGSLLGEVVQVTPQSSTLAEALQEKKRRRWRIF